MKLQQYASRLSQYVSAGKHMGSSQHLRPSLPELIALSKQKPGELSYATTGRGTLSHLTGEALQLRAGIKLLTVPYLGGTSQALNDVIAGRVPIVSMLTHRLGGAAGQRYSTARHRLAGGQAPCDKSATTMT
jgi:hypothetical protein